MLKAVLVAPLIVIVVLISYIFLDMKLVERSAGSCEALISIIEAHKVSAGDYPIELGELGLSSPESRCDYLKNGNSYMLSLYGSMLNLQVYVYNSEMGNWSWD